MAIHSVIHRGLFFSLPLAFAALAIFPEGPLFAQTDANAVTNSAPNPHAVEAQRRLALSHRRRLQETLQNEQNNELLTAGTQSPVEDTVKRPRHRALNTHRRTATGHPAVRLAISHRVSQ
jgi:hypothetical protein